MAALLRFGAARACRLLTTYTVRNSQIYQRSSLNVYKEQILKVWQPTLSSSRYLSSDTPAEEVYDQAEAETSSSGGDVEKGTYQSTRDQRPGRKAHSGEYKYQRDVKNLGTIVMTDVLLNTFKQLLQREGQVTSLQAYQILRNCASELVYENPESRIELAHSFWDKFIEAGVKPDVMLYNALLSVYIQNNHTFNPLELLEQMKSNDIEPNRTTLLLLMQAFGQMGDVAGTFKVLEFIKAVDMPLTEQVFASLITAYGLSGDFENAKGVFDLMRENGLEPDIDSYIALLCVYGENGDVQAITETIDEMQERRVYPNHNVFVSLIDSLSKRGHISIIKELLEKPMIKSLVKGDLKYLMRTVTTRGEMNTAFTLLGHIPRDILPNVSYGLNPEAILLRQVIRSNQPLELIMITINELVRLGVMKNVYEFALDHSFSAKHKAISLAIIQEMLRKGETVRPHYFYPIMAMHAMDKDAQGAQGLLDLMGQNGFQVDPLILKYMVRSFGNPDAKDVESFINMTQDVQLSPFLIRTLSELMMRTGQLEMLLKLIGYAKKESMDPLYIAQAFGKVILSKSFDPQTAVQILKLLDSEEYAAGMGTQIARAIDDSKVDSIEDVMKFITLTLQEGLGHHLDSRAYTFTLSKLQGSKMFTEFYEFVRTMKACSVELDEHHYRQLIKMMAQEGKAEAANFCLEKYSKLLEPDGFVLSYVIQAFGNCPEGGIMVAVPNERNLKRICMLYGDIEAKGLTLTSRGKAYSIIAHLIMGQIDKAEQILSVHGPGEPRYRVAAEFMKAYSRRGDVPKTKQWFEEVKEVSKIRQLPPFVYNNLIYVYGFHGDIERQKEVLKEMLDNGVTPNAFSFSHIMKSYLHKDDIESALDELQNAKQHGVFMSDSVCLLMVNSMARTGKTEHLERIVEDIITNRNEASYGKRWSVMLLGLVFGCLHAGRKDLALKLQLEHGVTIDSWSFLHFARHSAERGEADAILNGIEFLKENGIGYGDMYVPLVKAYDARRDPKSAIAVYEQIKASGVQPADRFLRILNQILVKYTEHIPPELQQHAQRSLEEQAVQDTGVKSEELLSEEGIDISNEKATD